MHRRRILLLARKPPVCSCGPRANKVGGGVLDSIVQRVQNAALMAIADGSEQITLELLKSATARPEACPLSVAPGGK